MWILFWWVFFVCFVFIVNKSHGKKTKTKNNALIPFTSSEGTSGLGAESHRHDNNTLLVLVFSWDVLTIRKIQNIARTHVHSHAGSEGVLEYQLAKQETHFDFVLLL